MKIIITRDNIFDTIVALNATNIDNAIDMQTIACALTTTTKIVRRHVRNLSSTLRVTYANRVVHANVNVNDDTRTNRDETRVRRDATRTSTTLTHDATRRTLHRRVSQ